MGRLLGALRATFRASVVALISLAPSSAGPRPWQLYAFRDGSYGQIGVELGIPYTTATRPSPMPPVPDPTWRAADAIQADVTGDGRPEWILLVWRPWRDWPIQRWLNAPSPIETFRGATGESCHLVVLDPVDGHEMWVGSALPVPLLALAVGDVDGDSLNEIVTLEGDYASGRTGPARRVDVWRWQGFGFVLDWRSGPSVMHELRLQPAPRGGILAIAVR